MCGITGVLVFEPQIPSESMEAREASVGRMASTLAHRGPDAMRTSRSSNGRCILGHTRLRIIDLETGEQPMKSPDGQIQVVFNGEIYNFRSLRSRLEAGGHTFQTRSDTEVIVHGFAEWGVGVFERLEGMFAIAVWDETAQVLTLGRDRAGQKPLFVYRDVERFAFGSEMKALLALPQTDLRLNSDAIPLFLMFGYVPSPDTLYKHIHKLPPGHWTQIRTDGTSTTRQFWRLDWTPQERSEDDAVSGVRQRLTEAVERRLVADVPLGAFLSGGVDSTIVVGLMSQLTGQRVRTFSIGFADSPGYDETSFARMASDRFNTDHTEFIVDPTSIETLHELVDVYDEPFGDSSAIPTRVVSRLTREHVTVALTGDGGDELFAGYPRFLGQALAAKLPRWGVAVGKGIAGLLPQAGHVRSPTRRFVRFMEAASKNEADRLLQWIGFLPPGYTSLMRPETLAGSTHEERMRSFNDPLRAWPEASALTRALALNFETYLLDDLLVKTDRCSMAHSLELRSPFLDTDVMEFAAGLEDRMRIRRGELKWILRRAFHDLLPPEIDRRPKMGFGIPLPKWLRGSWRSTVEDTLLQPGARILQWVRPEPLGVLVQDHMSGRRDHGHAVWALLTLESWLGRFPYETE